MAGFKGGMGGMGNMQNLMKQAQKMQEQMQEADKELEELEVVGLSGGGEEGDETVVVYMNGKKIINGAAMLFYQAYYAECIYFDRTANEAEAKRLFEEYKENIK